jgi:murein DD-endopeptidase MepM/ murein hydrolase activator NlpD
MRPSRLRGLGHLLRRKPRLPPLHRRPLAGFIVASAALLAVPLSAGPDPAPLPQPAAIAPVAGQVQTPGPDSGDLVPAVRPVSRSQPPETLFGYVWPLRGARITTWFAPTHGGFLLLGGQRVHDGIDLATFCGDWILAAHAGTVVYAGRRFDEHIGYPEAPDAFYALLEDKKVPLTALPIVVVIDDGNGYRSLYVHLRESLVKAGDRVRVGQRIGREGATGHATGCHLHYALVRMDGPLQAVAPQLVEKWHYPTVVRERVDPMRVLSMRQTGAGREVPGIPPPIISPGFGPIDLFHAVPGPREDLREIR